MKRHLHILVVEKGLAKTEQEARAKIMAGEVLVKGEPVTKPGFVVDEDLEVTLKEKLRFVSRGGAKLASVAPRLKLNFAGKVVLDVGSSTGGFTDYALQNGATKVYAVDSGTAQLAYKLRIDPRVVSMEKTDIRDVSLVIPTEAEGYPLKGDVSTTLNMTDNPVVTDHIDICIIDISFISITKILDAVAALAPDAVIVAMVKPQFEADKHVTDSTKGIIPTEAMRTAILKDFEHKVSEQFEIEAHADSKVSGMKGNVERFYKMRVKA